MSVTLAPSANLANAPLNARTAALAAALSVKASFGTVYGVTGYSTTAQFLQIHDKATAAVNTDVPLLSIPIAAGAAFNIDLGVYGLLCTKGIQIANSTTGPTLTAGAADTFITARYA
jgi:hypothetical protein